MTGSSPQPRPRLVDIAFWTMLVAAVLLISGGLLMMTWAFSTTADTPQMRTGLMVVRGLGIGWILAGGALAFLSPRTRRRDARFRRATVALSVAVVVVLGVFPLFARVVDIVFLLPMLLLVAAVILLTRPVVNKWFQR